MLALYSSESIPSHRKPSTTMPVAFISHPACRRHQMGDGHPEQPARLDAIEELLHVRQLHDFLVHHEAPRASVEQLARVHPKSHVERLGALSLDPVPFTVLVKADPRSVTGTGSSALAASQAGMSQASDPGPFPERVSAFPSSGNGPGSDAPAPLRTCAELPSADARAAGPRGGPPGSHAAGRTRRSCRGRASARMPPAPAATPSR